MSSGPRWIALLAPLVAAACSSDDDAVGSNSSAGGTSGGGQGGAAGDSSGTAGEAGEEMCENLGFIASDLAFESRVSEAIPSGMEDGVQLFTGACDTIAFPFAQDKPGGSGR